MVGACGRVGFDRDVAGTTGGDSAVPDDSVADVAPMVCGDGICVGNLGELCATCPSDCNTREVTVCGNGQCDPPEDSNSCYADCGPTPWTWTAEEDDLTARINTARTGGTDCPGGGGATTAPALTASTSLTLGAREWAWESTYHAWDTDAACNGRTYVERVEMAGATQPHALWIHFGSATPAGAMTSFLSDQATCESIMNTVYTQLGVGIAFVNARRFYYLILD